MSRLDELIQQHCPNGVEYKNVAAIAEVGTGSSNRADATGEGEYPFFVRSKNIERLDTYEYDDEAVIIPGEGGIGDIFHYVNGKYALHQRVYRIRFVDTSVNTKFAYYYFMANFKKFILQKAVTATVTSIRKPMIEKFAIPVPPLAVQEEIVRILDNFSELTAELAAELTARKKQYEYYRDELLTFDDSVEWKTLGEIATITRGGNLQKKDFRSEGYPCIHYGQIYTKYGVFTDTTCSFIDESIVAKQKVAKCNDVVMAITSENVEDVCKSVAWIGENDVAVSGHTVIIHHNQNPKFLSYYLHSKHFFEQKKRIAHGTKVIEVSPDKLAKISIPIPPLSEQQRIVDILDRFDALCNDISQGLPAEIEARQKQYEYYRDKLLSFSDSGVGVSGQKR